MIEGQSLEDLQKLATLVRYYSLAASTRAGSGHPTSSLSAADLMVGLMFGGAFRYDLHHPENPNNDRLIFSKGHASPLFYALWLAAGGVSEDEMMSYRRFGSPLEGHPTVTFRYTEAATGSLGQGLSIGVGLALNAKYLDELPYRTYVLLGDSEMAEGSQWEALQLAAHYRLGNLTAVLDVNRLGQRGETMYGWDLEAYRDRVAAFGWDTMVIDGHDFSSILEAFTADAQRADRPAMIIAKTIKGKGVRILEDRDEWHGKALAEDRLTEAIAELGPIDKTIRGHIPKPEHTRPQGRRPAPATPATGQAMDYGEAIDYPKDKPVATRHAFGNALVRLYPRYPDIVSLDGEVSNSTGADRFKKAHPERFFEMYVAEQNMAGVALGLSRRGKIPFASTFAAFWTRAFDQIRMSQYSGANIKFVGSHAGVSIGQDGPSQMGLEDIAMFRSLLDSVVVHPCDAVSTEKLVEELAQHRGIAYLRTLRQETPILYDPDEPFPIGGCKVLRKSDRDVATIVAAGSTVWEALAAYDELSKEGTAVRVIDLYSIKPLEEAMLRAAAFETSAIVTVEDHYVAGGLGEAVLSALAGKRASAVSQSAAEGVMHTEPGSATGAEKNARTPGFAPNVHILAVRKKPMSGTPAELLDYEGISAKAIVAKVKEITQAR